MKTIVFIKDFATKKKGDEFVCESQLASELVSIRKVAEFKKDKVQLLSATVGRTAPDFSWKEGDKEIKLSTLNDGEKYLLVFWSTSCPHCVKEIPVLHKSMTTNKKVSVISFGIENTDDIPAWTDFVKNLSGWHNVMGTHPDYKFDNETVKAYNLLGTPSYFILDRSFNF